MRLRREFTRFGLRQGGSEAVRANVRIGIAAIGPASVAFAHVVQSVLLVRNLSRADFGTFSFLFATVAFSWAIWAALFCVPLAALLFRTAEADRSSVEHSVALTNLIGAILTTPIFAAIGWGVGLDLAEALLLAGFNALTLLRWFGRAQAYCHGKQLRSVSSDLLYGFTLLAAVAVMAIYGRYSLTGSFLSMAAAALGGLLPFAGSIFAVLVRREIGSSLAAYWRESKANMHWSLLYPAATEMTANAHVYVVTILAGPSAFSTVAATALLVRPMSLISASIRDVERPRLARLASGREYTKIASSLLRVRRLLVGVWLLTVAATIILFSVNPRLLFPETYALSDLRIGAVLWSAVGGLALLRVPESALLQAVGSFRGVSLANLASAVISTLAVTALVLVLPPVWSIAGVLTGQLCNAAAISYYARQWRREHLPR